MDFNSTAEVAVTLKFVGGPKDGVVEEGKLDGPWPPMVEHVIQDGPRTDIYGYHLTRIESVLGERPLGTYVHLG